MDEKRSIQITFDPTTWRPTAVYYNAPTDVETEQLRRITNRMLTKIEKVAPGAET